MNVVVVKLNFSESDPVCCVLCWNNDYFQLTQAAHSILTRLLIVLLSPDPEMAVIGAKGNFAGPGASFDDTEDSKEEIVCSQVVI